MQNEINKLELTFKDGIIVIPFVSPVILKAKMIDNAPAFVFTHENKTEYYIFVDASSHVWKHTLPKFLSEHTTSVLLGAVDEYVFKVRQGNLPMTIFEGCNFS